MKAKDWLGLFIMVIGFIIMDSESKIVTVAIGFAIIMVGTSIFVRR